MSFDPSSPHAPLDPYLLAAIALTTIGAVVAGIYVSGAGEDFSQWFTEKFLQARAKSEKKVRQHAGGDKAEGVLKENWKKNSTVSPGELEDVSGGLGDEAAQNFGKGGIGKAFNSEALDGWEKSSNRRG